MNRATLCLAFGAALVAASASAQVTQSYRDWGESAVRYLMMKQEKTDWDLIRSDAEAKAFVELFWARRDPTPDTPVNEFRQQMEARLAEADKRYALRKTSGSQTDRGLVYVLLGDPSQIVPTLRRNSGPAGSSAQFQRPINIQTWVYRNQAAERAVGTKLFDIGFEFNDEKNATEFVLDGPSKRAFESTALTIAKSVLKKPFLTSADLGANAQPDRKVALRLIVVKDDATAHEVLRRAQEGENFADLARKYSSHASAQQGGYVGRVPFADLTDDFKMAFAGKEPGAVVLISRNPQFAVVRLLTEEEASAAEAELAKPK